MFNLEIRYVPGTEMRMDFIGLSDCCLEVLSRAYARMVLGSHGAPNDRLKRNISVSFIEAAIWDQGFFDIHFTIMCDHEEYDKIERVNLIKTFCELRPGGVYDSVMQRCVNADVNWGVAVQRNTVFRMIRMND